jgi:hypothetical protein
VCVFTRPKEKKQSTQDFFKFSKDIKTTFCNSQTVYTRKGEEHPPTVDIARSICQRKEA